MKKIIFIITLLVNTILTYANVDFNLAVEKMVTQNGNTTLVAVEETDPGDTLVYTLHISNNNNGTVSNITPTIPIPKYTTLIPGLVTPNTNYTVSIDEKTYKPYPYLGADGRPIPDSMYKAIRWTVNSMKPHEMNLFKFGVSVN
ncbi:hypothetical protein [uncultured Cetobacterium sp.]|uniref:hypothetical protein n=1 Tax=uncultured Cetobacterium sp. TaxID=527638 RepID=UPI002627486A|nr:hypothetical protein [uncultured Cetobacterium sp.]